MTNKEASATLSVFQEDILNNLWLSNEQRKGLAEAIDLAIKALEERSPKDLSEYSDKLWKKAYERGKSERPIEEKEHKERIFNPFDHRTIGEI